MARKLNKTKIVIQMTNHYTKYILQILHYDNYSFDIHNKYSAHFSTRLAVWKLYPFHIKPIMRSQRRFENNAV